MSFSYLRPLKVIMVATSTIISVACMVIFVPWLAGCAYLKPLPNTIQEQANNASNYGLDGIVVYVQKGRAAPEFYTAGWKSRESKVPADSQALFKIASISKLYMAAAAARLVNRKTISLDKSLVDYLPELAGKIEYADKITLKMMLQHRSGVPDFIDDPELSWENLPTTTSELLKYGLDKPADFKPDSDYRYSNTNYLLIGMILDQTLGYSHHQYIKKEILDPLKLTHTYSLLSEVDIKKVTSGYYIGYDGDLKTQNFVGPGGSMVATAEDVGIFLRALNDGSLLNTDEQAIYSFIYKYEHTGLLGGYSSIARYHKDIDTVVIQFVNTSGGNSWMMTELMYKRIVQILHRE